MASDRAPSIPTFTTLKRSFGISKIHIALAIFFAIMLLTVWNPGFLASVGAQNSNATSNSSSSIVQSIRGAHSSANGGLAGYSLIGAPLGILPAIMLSTPIILLFVYDKNNGMLEYFLSLGMRQREIYTSYLKAALLAISIFFILYAPVYLGLGYLSGSLPLDAVIYLLMVLLSFGAVSFMIIAMFAFSTLQKTRAGSNQPIGLIVGVVWMIPAVFAVVLLPQSLAIAVDLGEAALLIVLSVVMLFAAGRLISREKLLP